jgi:hypothetical protein
LKLSDLSGHPDNNNIYDPTDLTDLEQSLSAHGQLEPIAITKDKLIISGHRRFAAMKSLGWTDCEVRIVEPENEIIALIEHNRHRQKTKGDILREAKFLEIELRKTVGRGRNASKTRTGKKQGKRITTVREVADRLGVGTTQLKQLQSISNYEPKLIEKIDSGKISVAKAYREVQEKHISKQTRFAKKVGNDELFRIGFGKLVKQYNPSHEVVTNTLKNTYPYSIPMTGLSQTHLDDFYDHMDKLAKLDSREAMYVRKRDELEHLEVSNKELRAAEKLLPSNDELNEFWSNNLAIFDTQLVVTDDKFKCPKSKLNFDKRLWDTLRVCISSHEHFSGPGRKMDAFVGFNNKKGFRLLGIIGFSSDSHTLGVRDDHIGWTTDQRGRMREHLVNMNTCVPTQPFGYNRLGGKFISLYAEELVRLWEKKYNQRIVGITTTSLHGSQGQYNGMKWWKSLGSSSGAMLISPLRDEWSFWRGWLKDNYPEEYETATSRTSPKQALLTILYSLTGLSKGDYTHNHKRGVFFRPLYSNYREFLCEEIKEGALEYEDGAWHDWYFLKMRKRIEELIKRKDVQTEPLFYEGIDADVLEMWLSSRGAV